jgi:UDP:flavonoid glycosyltransferase YjiC (YdhE family)
MVTNGGYGGVQGALSHGLPLVVAGASEDKPEVAARVAWAGAGINLRRGKPTPAKVRSAVLKVLSEPAYRARARELQKECSQYSAVATITTLLEELAEPKV